MFKSYCLLAAIAVSLAVAALYYSAESLRFKREAEALKERISVQNALFEAERVKAGEKSAHYERKEAAASALASAARLRLRKELEKNNSCERELELIGEELGKIVVDSD